MTHAPSPIASHDVRVDMNTAHRVIPAPPPLTAAEHSREDLKASSYYTCNAFLPVCEASSRLPSTSCVLFSPQKERNSVVFAQPGTPVQQQQQINYNNNNSVARAVLLPTGRTCFVQPSLCASMTMTTVLATNCTPSTASSSSPSSPLRGCNIAPAALPHRLPSQQQQTQQQQQQPRVVVVKAARLQYGPPSSPASTSFVPAVSFSATRQGTPRVELKVMHHAGTTTLSVAVPAVRPVLPSSSPTTTEKDKAGKERKEEEEVMMRYASHEPCEGSVAEGTDVSAAIQVNYHHDTTTISTSSAATTITDTLSNDAATQENRAETDRSPFVVNGLQVLHLPHYITVPQCRNNNSNNNMSNSGAAAQAMTFSKGSAAQGRRTSAPSPGCSPSLAGGQHTTDHISSFSTSHSTTTTTNCRRLTSSSSPVSTELAGQTCPGNALVWPYTGTQGSTPGKQETLGTPLPSMCGLSWSNETQETQSIEPSMQSVVIPEAAQRFVRDGARRQHYAQHSLAGHAAC